MVFLLWTELKRVTTSVALSSLPCSLPANNALRAVVRFEIGVTTIIMRSHRPDGFAIGHPADKARRVREFEDPSP